MLRKLTLILVLALIFAAGSIVTSDAAIVRVAKRLQVLEFYGGYAQPLGSYEGIHIIRFLDSGNLPVDLDADQVYDPSAYFGFNYGQLMSEHYMFTIGLRWTRINTLDTFWTDTDYGWTYEFQTPTFNQYDIDLNANYFFADPSSSVISPYAGIGLHGGITSISSDFIEAENNVTMAAGINFGADLTIWKSPSDRSMVALSSTNEWIFAASEDRPKYLNIGAALKYYFRP